MNNNSFWASVRNIIDDGFTSEGVDKLERYAELFSTGQCLFKRLSPEEQHGCSAGGSTHVVATILAGAENRADKPDKECLRNFKSELKCAAKQAATIEHWARVVGCWIDNADEWLKDNFGEMISEGGEAKVYDNGPKLIKTIGLDYFILPTLALDRISLHNTYFPETTLHVLGFGRNSVGDFKIIVEQAFIEGTFVQEDEIESHICKLGFDLRNKRNWTYSTPYIYLSDLHDENVIKSVNGKIYVIDCDIRINTPDLKLGGVRKYSDDVEFI